MPIGRPRKKNHSSEDKKLIKKSLPIGHPKKEDRSSEDKKLIKKSMPIGRPKKEDRSSEDKKLLNKRNYHRNYQSQVKAGIEQLFKDEKSCLTDLNVANKEIDVLRIENDKLMKDRKILLKFVEECDKQLLTTMATTFKK